MQAKQKANNDPTYSTTLSFNWADDVDASIDTHRYHASQTCSHHQMLTRPSIHFLPHTLMCPVIFPYFVQESLTHGQLARHHAHKNHIIPFVRATTRSNTLQYIHHTPLKPKHLPPLAFSKLYTHMESGQQNLSSEWPASDGYGHIRKSRAGLCIIHVKSAPHHYRCNPPLRSDASVDNSFVFSDGLQIPQHSITSYSTYIYIKLFSPFSFPSLFFSRFTFS